MYNTLAELLEIINKLLKVFTPVLFFTAVAGGVWMLYHGWRKRDYRFLALFAGTAVILLLLIIFRWERMSSRHFIWYICPVIIGAGMIFNLLYRWKKIAGVLMALIFVLFFGIKNVRYDKSYARVRQYLSKLKSDNKTASSPFLFVLDRREFSRFSQYARIPSAKLPANDIQENYRGILARNWQRYIYLHDPVYLGLLSPSDNKPSLSDIPGKVNCEAVLEFECPKGNKGKKTFQFFRFSNAPVNVDFPETATSEIPFCDPSAAENKSPLDIAPGWYVMGETAEFWKSGKTRYECLKTDKHWQIGMSGYHILALHSKELDFSKPFDCYLDYSGTASEPLEVVLIMYDGTRYRDIVASYLPLDGRKRKIKLSFYPEMNPEKIPVHLCLRMKNGGKADISRMSFDKPVSPQKAKE